LPARCWGLTGWPLVFFELLRLIDWRQVGLPPRRLLSCARRGRVSIGPVSRAVAVFRLTCPAGSTSKISQKQLVPERVRFVTIILASTCPEIRTVTIIRARSAGTIRTASPPRVAVPTQACPDAGRSVRIPMVR
jgi:hypothetical protein